MFNYLYSAEARGRLRSIFWFACRLFTEDMCCRSAALFVAVVCCPAVKRFSDVAG